MKNDLWDQAKKIQKTLHQKGHTTYACGGFVRDFLLKRPCHDIDLATTATPEIMANIFSEVGIAFVDVGMRFGTLICPTAAGQIEITTLRCDIETDGRHAKTQFINSFELDAKRRDFTVNGLFMDLETQEIFDFVQGKKDLEKQILRFIGDPKTRIFEDHLRVLRFFRFLSQLGFSPEELSLKKSIEFLPHLSKVSVERMRNETFKLLVGNHVENLFSDEQYLDVLLYLFPEFRLHQENLSLCVDFLKECKEKKDPILSLSGLGILAGKGINVSEFLSRWKLSKKENFRFVFLFEHYEKIDFSMTNLDIRHLIFQCLNANSQYESTNGAWDDLCFLFFVAQRITETSSAKIQKFRQRLGAERRFFTEHLGNAECPLTGKEIQDSFHLKPGTIIKECKNYLIHQMLLGHLTKGDKKKALRMLKEYLETKFD